MSFIQSFFGMVKKIECAKVVVGGSIKLGTAVMNPSSMPASEQQATLIHLLAGFFYSAYTFPNFESDSAGLSTIRVAGVTATIVGPIFLANALVKSAGYDPDTAALIIDTALAMVAQVGEYFSNSEKQAASLNNANNLNSYRLNHRPA